MGSEMCIRDRLHTAKIPQKWDITQTWGYVHGERKIICAFALPNEGPFNCGGIFSRTEYKIFQPHHASCMVIHQDTEICDHARLLVTDQLIAVYSPVVQRHAPWNRKARACGVWCEAFAPQTAKSQSGAPPTVPLHQHRIGNDGNIFSRMHH